MVSTVNSSSDSEDTSSNDDEQFMDYLTIQNFHSVQPSKVPLAQVQIFIDGLPSPIAQTIANPFVLPSFIWKEQKMFFKTTDENVFSIDFISRPITIQFFLGCTVTKRILGSPLPQKDLVVGFDIITSKLGLKLSGKRIKYKQYFQPWQSLPNFFTMSPQPNIFDDIK